MSKQLLRKAISDLKINEPYSLKGKNIEFAKPEPTIGSSDQWSNQPLVETTSGATDPGLNQPEVEATTGSKEKGSFMIPHEIFSYCQKISRSKNEMVIFNCLLRYTLGFHRSECEASLAYISKWTGLSDKQNIAKALKRLQEKELIVKKINHDSRKLKGAIYSIPIVAEYLSNKGVVKSTPGRNNQWLKQPTTSGRNYQLPVVENTNKKEILNKNINKALSPELESYFEKLPERKRVKESLALQSLSESYSQEEIDMALAWVQKHGAPNTGEPVHSPLAFLGTAMNEVLEASRSEIEKDNARALLAKQAFETKAREKVLADNETLTWQEVHAAFEKAFPDPLVREVELKNQIARISFCAHLPKAVAEKIATKEWYKNLNKF